MGIKTNGTAFMVQRAYIAYLVITVVLIVMFGQSFGQILNLEGVLAPGDSEVLNVLAYGESGPSPATDPTMIK